MNPLTVFPDPLTIICPSLSSYLNKNTMKNVASPPQMASFEIKVIREWHFLDKHCSSFTLVQVAGLDTF